MKTHSFFNSPLGTMCVLATDGAITHILINGKPGQDSVLCSGSPHAEAAAQLSEYFAGTRKEFSLPLAPAGTPFQQSVWKALCGIPYGQTRSYGQIAAAVGNPKASRAVGMANNRNPILLVVPCHRVIGANSSLTGYGAGLHAKEYLLKLETGSG